MTEVDLEVLLSAVDQHVVDELACMPEVDDKGHNLDVKDLPGDERKWHRVSEAIAVVADLKNSTQLGLNKRAPSTASIYEAATGNVATIFDKFEADFIAIQGDGAFAMFWGEGRKRRAVCAAITVQTFGIKSLAPKLASKWDTLPETGLKVGVAYSPLLVKRVGIERTDSHEPVWAGRAVNYAAKSAQQADQGQMIVTGTMWDWIANNDYLAASCDCGTPSTDIWEDATIEKIPDVKEAAGEREGKMLVSSWCSEHGAEYCSAVLSGKRSRPGVRDKIDDALELEYKSENRKAAKLVRESYRRERELSETIAWRQRQLIANRRGLRRIS